MNVAIHISVGAIDVTLDATDVHPDGLTDLCNRAATLVRALVSDEDLHAAAVPGVVEAEDPEGQ